MGHGRKKGKPMRLPQPVKAVDYKAPTIADGRRPANEDKTIILGASFRAVQSTSSTGWTRARRSTSRAFSDASFTLIRFSPCGTKGRSRRR
eukprot:981834-Rhodomonas_salina.2